MSRFKEATCSECEAIMQIDTTEQGTHTGMCGPCHYDKLVPNFWSENTLSKLVHVRESHEEAGKKV